MSNDNYRFFYIQRMGPEAHVLDVSGNNPARGTNVIAYPRGNGKANQQWEFVPARQSGWWYLRTRMASELVMTLDAEGTPQPPRIVMQPKLDDDVRQLWCLVSTEKPGYWFVQSRLVVSNAADPVVIGTIGGGAGDPPNAVSVQLDYLGFETQCWAFSLVHEQA